MNIRALAPVLLLLAIPGNSHAQQPADSSAANSPVGHWVAEHPKGGAATWWEFRPDGSLTQHTGAMATYAIKRSGKNAFTMPSATAGGPPAQLSFRIEGDTLYIKASQASNAAQAPEASFTRVGPAPSSTDPLLGKWRPNPPAGASPDAAKQNPMSNGLVVFSADGTEIVRVPVRSKQGMWDADAHTFHFQNETVVYSFARKGSKLVLGQPPKNETDTYVPDPIM